MRLFQRLASGLTRRLVARAPRAALMELGRNHLELVVRHLNRDELLQEDGHHLPSNVAGFEDLAFLFWATPLNRGLLRQDLDEAAALFRAIRSLQAPRGVEIGRFRGGSTILLAAAVGEHGRLHSIDISPRDDTQLRQMLDRLALLPRVELIVGDANEIDLDGVLDFVLIDGDHEYEAARRDHNAWGPRLRPGGLLAHHDMAAARSYATQWPQLARLRDEILTTQAGELEVFCEAGSLTIFRRVGTGWTAV